MSDSEDHPEGAEKLVELKSKEEQEVGQNPKKKGGGKKKKAKALEPTKEDDGAESSDGEKEEKLEKPPKKKKKAKKEKEEEEEPPKKKAPAKAEEDEDSGNPMDESEKPDENGVVWGRESTGFVWDKEEYRSELDVIRILSAYHPKAPAYWDKHYVLVSTWFSKIDRLSTADSTCSVEITVGCFWRAKELVGKVHDKFDIAKIWKPTLSIHGAEGVEAEKGDGAGTYWIQTIFSKHGIVNWNQKFKATVPMPMHLQMFPFDQQLLRVTLESGGSDAWGEDQCVLVDHSNPEMTSKYSKRINVSEWSLVKPVEIFETRWTDPQDPILIYSQLCYDFHFRRFTGFYMKNICLLVYIISIMSWAIFIIPPDIINDRLQVAITLFLALVAFNFAISEIIPKISYSTRLSQYFIVNYILLMLNALESVISFLIFKYHSLPIALYIDWSALAAFGLTSSIYTLQFIFRGQAASRAVQPLLKDPDVIIVRTGGGETKFADIDVYPVTATVPADTAVHVEKDKAV